MLAIFKAIGDGARNGFSEPRDRAAKSPSPRPRQPAETARPAFKPQNGPPIAGSLSETGKRLFGSDCVVGLEGLEPPSKPLLRTSPAVRKAYFSRARKETLPLTR